MGAAVSQSLHDMDLSVSKSCKSIGFGIPGDETALVDRILTAMVDRRDELRWRVYHVWIPTLAVLFQDMVEETTVVDVQRARTVSWTRHPINVTSSPSLLTMPPDAVDTVVQTSLFEGGERMAMSQWMDAGSSTLEQLQQEAAESGESKRGDGAESVDGDGSGSGSGSGDVHSGTPAVALDAG